MNVLALVAPYRLSDTVDQPVQVLRTGHWYFPEYGDVEITPADLQQYAANFKANVRRQAIPVVIEHNHELGSFGEVKDLTISEDGQSLYAHTSWNERGKELVQSGAFSYSSAEIFPDYLDAETQENHKNVFSAYALTNFPRLKGMNKIAAGEKLPWAYDLSAAKPLQFADILVGMRSVTVPEEKTPVVLSVAAPLVAPTPEVTATQFAELQAKLASNEQRFTEMSTKLNEQATLLAEAQRVATIERATRVLVECGEKIDNAKRQGRITPAQAEKYLTELPKASDEMREWVFADISTRPATALPLGELGNGAKPDGATTDNDFGGAREALAKRQATIFNEKKGTGAAVTMVEALYLANNELRQGVTR